MTRNPRTLPQLWEQGGSDLPAHATSPDPGNGSARGQSDQMSHCVTLVGFAEIVGLSEKTMRRLLAANLLPGADLIVGGSQRRWTRRTVEAWLRTRPRLPGRGGKRGGRDAV
jgi:hypothetical protein